MQTLDSPVQLKLNNYLIYFDEFEKLIESLMNQYLEIKTIFKIFINTK